MIQRIQTVWLLLAIALNPLTIFTELWIFEFNTVNSQSTVVFHGQYIKNLNSTLSIFVPAHPIRWIFILSILFCISALVTIFLYKKRQIQKRVAWLSAGIAFLQTSYIFWRVYYTQNQISQFAGVNALQSSNVQIGVIFPILSIAFCLLAAYYIEKDDRLVRDMNSFRLRG
ncbi:MAG: DUF4293 domain-containing protein [Bacteroidia bacterium]|nr:DUF4293 domain-containing protein [Bacteroidia bacterium]MDW8302539.1 DUF4293 domain-containing protein [Bacteroidia bacterium]